MSGIALGIVLLALGTTVFLMFALAFLVLFATGAH